MKGHFKDWQISVAFASFVRRAVMMSFKNFFVELGLFLLVVCVITVDARPGNSGSRVVEVPATEAPETDDSATEDPTTEDPVTTHNPLEDDGNTDQKLDPANALSTDDRNILSLFNYPFWPNKKTPKSDPTDDNDSSVTVDPKLLRSLQAIGLREQFSPLLRKHARIAGQLVGVYLRLPTKKDFYNYARALRGKINYELFMYALSTAVLHRNDTANLPIKQITEIFPGKFVDMNTVREIAQIARDEFSKNPSEVSTTLSPNDINIGNIDKRSVLQINEWDSAQHFNIASTTA